MDQSHNLDKLHEIVLVLTGEDPHRMSSHEPVAAYPSISGPECTFLNER